MSAKQAEKLIENLGILVVDESLYMRKLTRMMLMNIGAKTIYEASDGVAALDTIRSANPDVAIIDWDLPVLSGPQVVKIVRSPDVFPKPHLPIIMLTASADRSRVGGSDAARRARVPAQADVAARVAGSSAVDHREAARDGADRRTLRAGAARPRRPSQATSAPAPDQVDLPEKSLRAPLTAIAIVHSHVSTAPNPNTIRPTMSLASRDSRNMPVPLKARGPGPKATHEPMLASAPGDHQPIT